MTWGSVLQNTGVTSYSSDMVYSYVNFRTTGQMQTAEKLKTEQTDSIWNALCISIHHLFFSIADIYAKFLITHMIKQAKIHRETSMQVHLELCVTGLLMLEPLKFTPIKSNGLKGWGRTVGPFHWAPCSQHRIYIIWSPHAYFVDCSS